jgi:hypothetical protein
MYLVLVQVERYDANKKTQHTRTLLSRPIVVVGVNKASTLGVLSRLHTVLQGCS